MLKDTTMPTTQRRKQATIVSAITQKKNVMSAVILRDMRTRFFNHGLGFLLVALWPLAHMVILLAIARLTGRHAPYGESLNVFFATGLIPTLAFMYVSRFMSYSMILNKPMLAFPLVKPFDIMAGRAFLEIIAAFLTLGTMLAILALAGENPIPVDMEQAVLAYMSALLLAVGVGTLVGVIVTFFPPFVTIYALALIVIYLSSGTMLVVSALPDQIAIPLSYNPVMGVVEWMRTAYYPTYSDRLVSKTYIVGFGLGALFLGLVAERALRARVLEG